MQLQALWGYPHAPCCSPQHGHDWLTFVCDAQMAALCFLVAWRCRGQGTPLRRCWADGRVDYMATAGWIGDSHCTVAARNSARAYDRLK